jgi:putative iron-dependent peroxidase
MTNPQMGIFAQGTRTHHHLELDVRPGATDEQLRAALSRVQEPSRTAGGANIVIGCGADLWKRLSTTSTPDALAPFTAIEGVDGRRMPATQHDLWIWIHGTGADLLFDMASAVTAALDGVADLAAEQPAFTYHDGRDLTGFIDGTANPPAEEAAEVALVPDGAVGAGGSFAIVSRFVHDLASFHTLPVADQEHVFGRTKPDSIELDDKGDDAHISRVEIDDDDGEELELYRRSVPFGSVGEAGLVFVGFSADPTRFTRMLHRMYGIDDGVHDRLLDFTTATTGAFYFVPSLDDWSAAVT